MSGEEEAGVKEVVIDVGETGGSVVVVRADEELLKIETGALLDQLDRENLLKVDDMVLTEDDFGEDVDPVYPEVITELL